MRRKYARIGAALVGLLLAATALAAIGYRTFAPDETLIGPSTDYPAAGPIFDARPFSELRAAPLVVDRRLRVYAEKWRVWSDGPVGARYEGTPYWAFRRWPAQVIGVVAADTSDGPQVISQWSDGAIVAIDARRGAVSWRANVPVDQGGYTGRRTGANTVYQPPELLTAARGQTSVVLSTGQGRVRAFDARSGASLWARDLDQECEDSVWTGPGLLVVPDCAGTAVTLVDALTGRDRGRWAAPKIAQAPTGATAGAGPGGCAVGRSGCRLITVAKQAWLVAADATVTSIGQLPQDAIIAGDRLVYTGQAGVTSRPLTGDGRRWTWNGQGRLIGASADGVYLLTDDLTMLGLDLGSGRLSVVGCAATTLGQHWYVGHVYTAPGGEYVAVERLSHTDGAHTDQEYFYGPRPVALVELYPPKQLPIWPAKFAACRPL